MLALPPFVFVLCLFLPPFFSPPAEKMEALWVFTLKLLLTPSHALLWHGAFLWGCAPSSTIPHFWGGGGGGSGARLWGRQRQGPCTQHSLRPSSVPAPATPSPWPGPSRTCCSSVRSACWAFPPPRPSPMRFSCCSHSRSDAPPAPLCTLELPFSPPPPLTHSCGEQGKWDLTSPVPQDVGDLPLHALGRSSPLSYSLG